MTKLYVLSTLCSANGGFTVKGLIFVLYSSLNAVALSARHVCCERTFSNTIKRIFVTGYKQEAEIQQKCNTNTSLLLRLPLVLASPVLSRWHPVTSNPLPSHQLFVAVCSPAWACHLPAHLLPISKQRNPSNPTTCCFKSPFLLLSYCSALYILSSNMRNSDNVWGSLPPHPLFYPLCTLMEQCGSTGVYRSVQLWTDL